MFDCPVRRQLLFFLQSKVCLACIADRFVRSLDQSTKCIVRSFDSQVYPPVKPRPPEKALFPAGERSVAIGDVDLGDEKYYQTCLW